MTYIIDQQTVNTALFSFLKSIYLYEKREYGLFGIAWDEVYLLQLLVRTPGICITQLSDKLCVKKFVISRMLTRLEKAGLTSREIGFTDKRIVNVYITKAGKSKLDAIEAYNYKTVCAQFDKLSEENLRSLLHSISNLDELLSLNDTESFKN
jgi:DNA-binding MarR family transcriptional regulator